MRIKQNENATTIPYIGRPSDCLDVFLSSLEDKLNNELLSTLLVLRLNLGETPPLMEPVHVDNIETHSVFLCVTKLQTIYKTQFKRTSNSVPTLLIYKLIIDLYSVLHTCTLIPFIHHAP